MTGFTGLGLWSNRWIWEGGILGSVQLSWSRASLCTPCRRMQAFSFHMYLLFSIFSCPLIGKSFTRLTISGWITVCRTGLPAPFMTESCICYPEFSASNLDGVSMYVCVYIIMCMCTHTVKVNGSPVWICCGHWWAFSFSSNWGPICTNKAQDTCGSEYALFSMMHSTFEIRTYCRLGLTSLTRLDSPYSVKWMHLGETFSRDGQLCSLPAFHSYEPSCNKQSYLYWCDPMHISM